jgi:hypothetical protein
VKSAVYHTVVVGRAVAAIGASVRLVRCRHSWRQWSPTLHACRAAFLASCWHCTARTVLGAGVGECGVAGMLRSRFEWCAVRMAGNNCYVAMDVCLTLLWQLWNPSRLE